MTNDELLDEYCKAGAAYLNTPFGSLADKATGLAYKYWQNAWLAQTGFDLDALRTDDIGERITKYRKAYEKSNP